jgi:hypothetical protein
VKRMHHHPLLPSLLNDLELLNERHEEMLAERGTRAFLGIDYENLKEKLLVSITSSPLSHLMMNLVMFSFFFSLTKYVIVIHTYLPD